MGLQLHIPVGDKTHTVAHVVATVFTLTKKEYNICDEIALHKPFIYNAQ